ncbi:thymidine phosphorylase family protein [Henriciella aquimarina]|uniref:thymidine phosphorylase family protein n=1 Tax=Henriciella aquimarina TaxID=545261 RepID=UPI000A06F785|nr:thymidine phosphorylase family protein [Henriciella aquimarina]
MSSQTTNRLQARRVGLLTQHEAIALVHTDCSVCRSEGVSAHSRVTLTHNGKSIIATLYQLSSDLFAQDSIGLSEAAWSSLGVAEGDEVQVTHSPPIASLTHVRQRIFDDGLTDTQIRSIVADIVSGVYSDIHLTAFVTAIAAKPLSDRETVSLTRAMIETGDRMEWPRAPVVDKHCVGGLPGNRTTPIVVAITAANGLLIPKTSSRAITSPAGTADTMETLTPVNLDRAAMRRVIEQTNGCFIWGDSVRFSPADTDIIRIERALNFDSPGAMIASVLSKKIAAGSTHVVIDIPVGPTAKVRSLSDAKALARLFTVVADSFGLKLSIEITDGRQPVGRGIGPALEARDVLAVLRKTKDAPADLRDRALQLAGAVLELAGTAEKDAGYELAAETLESGKAWEKFLAICEAQGGFHEPPTARYQRPVNALRDGRVAVIDNRRLARAAKLAGAPDDKAAGLDLKVRVGDTVRQGDPLFVLHTETMGELTYVLDYVNANPGIVELTR